MNDIVLINCNKVSKESFSVLYKRLALLKICTHHTSLTSFSDRMDVLTYDQTSAFMDQFVPVKAVVIADIFWPTGQNICRWCQEKQVKCFFWQHGQWIYTKNKKNPRFLPTATFFLGDKISRECSKWPYGKRSKLFVSGSPRYDNVNRNTKGNYVYFSPPAMLEKNPSVADKYNFDAKKVLEKLAGLDNEVDLMIHPHYREGHIKELKQMFPKAKFGYLDASPVDLIEHATKVLTHRNSTVVLDAIACGKQVVTMNLDVIPSSYPKGHFENFVAESDSPDHCLYNLNEPDELPDDDYNDCAREHILLGSAAERITNYIASAV